jgi:hypothetical protein
MVGIAIMFLAGFTQRPKILGAHVKKGHDKTEIVEIIISANDAKVIKEREMYFSIVVVDCKNFEIRFPIDPYIGGKLASNFEFPVAEGFVIAQGVVPERIFVAFPTPCFALEGGGYLFGKIDTSPVPLVRVAR